MVKGWSSTVVVGGGWMVGIVQTMRELFHKLGITGISAIINGCPAAAATVWRDIKVVELTQSSPAAQVEAASAAEWVRLFCAPPMNFQSQSPVPLAKL